MTIAVITPAAYPPRPAPDGRRPGEVRPGVVRRVVVSAPGRLDASAQAERLCPARAGGLGGARAGLWGQSRRCRDRVVMWALPRRPWHCGAS